MLPTLVKENDILSLLVPVLEMKLNDERKHANVLNT